MAAVKGKQKAQEECPICFEFRDDIQQLVHVAGGAGDVSGHRACGVCRAAMLKKNQQCPWCRNEVVWQNVFGFLDTLKNRVGKAHDPDSLADLMSRWQEYEMTRTNSDVMLFARDMIMDVALCAHLDRSIKSNHGWLRDSGGLWCRFHCMVADGELQLPEEQYATRLRRAVECALSTFEQNGGNAAEHGGAMYCQLAVATLCAMHCGMSTKTLEYLTRRVGRACHKFWSRVQSRVPQAYVAAISERVWGSAEADPFLYTFYRPAGAAKQMPYAALANLKPERAAGAAVAAGAAAVAAGGGGVAAIHRRAGGVAPLNNANAAAAAAAAAAGGG